MANNKDYSSYEIYDLLMDDHFKKWALSNGEDMLDNEHWQKVMQYYPEKKEMILHARQMVRQLKSTATPPVNRQQALWHRIDQNTPIDVSPVTKTVAQLILPYLKHVAVVTAIIGIGLLIWQRKMPANLQLGTGNGESRTLLLPDSSEIQLGGNSVISYHKVFNNDSAREVWIKGDANFKVKHINTDPAKIIARERFIVHLEHNVDVEVLGTVFSVADRRGKAVVNLESGSVKISTPQKKQLLKPGESAVYWAGKPLIIKKDTKPAVKRQWQSNTLLMEKSDVSQIIAILEDNYGLRINAPAKQIMDKQLDGALPLNDEHKALSILTSITGTHIVKEQNTITLLAN